MEAAPLSLWQAIDTGHVEFVRAILKDPSVDLNEEQGAHRWSVPMRLVYQQTDEVAEALLPTLLEAGANLHAVNDEVYGYPIDWCRVCF